VGVISLTQNRSGAGSVSFGTLLLALFLFPLYPKIGLVPISGTYIPIRLDDVITVGATVAWGVSLIAERRRPRIPPLAGFAVAWLLAGLVALIVGAGLQHTISATTGAFYWAKPIEYLLLGWMAFDLVTSRKRLKSVLTVILASAAVVIMYGLLQRLGLTPPPPTYIPGASFSVLTSTMSDPHELAIYLGLVAVIVMALWQYASTRWRLVGSAFLVALAYVLVHAGVRSEFIALLIVTVAFLWWRRTRLPSALLLASLLTVFFLPAGAESFLASTIAQPQIVTPGASATGGQPQIVAPGASVPLSAGSISVGDRFAGDLSRDVSLSTRLQNKWPNLLRIAWAHPFFGGGPSVATEAADGYYVRSLAEIGVIGTIAFLGLLLATLARLGVGFVRGGGLPGWLALAAFLGTLFVAAVGVLIDTWVSSRPMQLYWPLVGAALAGLLLPSDPPVAGPEAESKFLSTTSLNSG
jgi:O-Antigen ligase